MNLVPVNFDVILSPDDPEHIEDGNGKGAGFNTAAG